MTSQARAITSLTSIGSTGGFELVVDEQLIRHRETGFDEPGERVHLPLQRFRMRLRSQ